MSQPIQLREALQRLVNAALVGQKRGVWSMQEAAALDEAVKFLARTAVMVVPPQMLQRAQDQAQQLPTIQEEVTMKSEREPGPVGAETTVQKENSQETKTV